MAGAKASFFSGYGNRTTERAWSKQLARKQDFLLS
jgi:hypothetical protein